jgi:hypothetical protein
MLLAVPGAGDAPAVEAWLDARRAFLRDLRPSDAGAASVEPLTHTAAAPPGPLGRHADPRWRAFVLGTFLADLASYPEPVDQVDLARLLYLMHVFPRGFRLWGAEAPDLGWVPVGYSGWYPIAETSFARLAQPVPSLRDRLVPALPEVAPGGSFLHVFNFSVVRALRGTVASKRLVRALAADLAGERALGLSAITVSPEGARVCARFGMERTGSLVVDGCEEGVFTRRGPG